MKAAAKIEKHGGRGIKSERIQSKGTHNVYHQKLSLSEKISARAKK